MVKFWLLRGLACSTGRWRSGSRGSKASSRIQEVSCGSSKIGVLVLSSTVRHELRDSQVKQGKLRLKERMVSF